MSVEVSGGIRVQLAEGMSQSAVAAALAAHNDLATAHGLNANIKAAQLGAAAPSALNPFATMADVGPSLSDYQNVVVVDAGGKGDYTTIESATASITDAAPTKRYGVVVMPGVYTPVSPINLKNCVDIKALVPGTVLITASAGFTTMGLLDCAVEIADGFTLSGLRIDYSRTNKIAVCIYTLGQCNNVTIDNCHIRCTAASGTVCMALDFGGVSSGRSFVRNCIVETINAAPVRAAFGWSGSGTGELHVIDSLLRHARTESGSMVTEVAGSGLRIYRSRIVGGEFSVGDTGEAASAAIAHCEITGAISELVTNLIETPYNVVDANV